MDILPCPFCGNSDIEPSRYDVDMYDGTDGVTVYDVQPGYKIDYATGEATKVN